MTPTPLTHPPAPHTSRVQIASHGLGQTFALVVLNPLPVWSRPPHGQDLPERTDEGHNLLAVRWHGLQDIDDEVLTALNAAAERAPNPPVPQAELAQYQDSLPDHLHLVALPATTVLGPWAPNPDTRALHAATVAPAQHTGGHL
ncbi:hypothetical protein [Streptomyces montanus]|uniref:hypothetical protein n=1 Tax=Streptomyces montanus TaxID=2580423 RepID=UPI0014865996|nr:hypothetical protein [Streptomyces montanus]